MSALEQVSKLETLLARIKSRAGASRSVAAPEPVVARAASAASVAPSIPPEPPPRVASVPPAPPPRVDSVPPEAILAGQLQTTPPPSMGSEPPPTQAQVDAMVLDGEMEVEVSTEMVEVDIDEDDHAALTDEGYPRESAVLVADQGRAPVEETIDEDLVAESIPPDEPPANEVIEPAPSSSPRAIDSYETTPRHTPPPESGKQVAVASVKPDPRMSSSPPPSEGHTLMGGWREPGMPLRGGEARPGVRVPPPPPPPPPAELLHSAPPPPPPGSATPSIAAKPMTSDATVPAFPPFTEIGIIESPASSFAPATFGELLDASLSL